MVFDRNSLFFASVSHFFKPKVRKYFDDAKTSCKYNNINKKFIISCTGTGIEGDTEQKKNDEQQKPNEQRSKNRLACSSSSRKHILFVSFP